MNMATSRVLSQGEIDNASRKGRHPGNQDRDKTRPYDFRRAERLPKDLLQAVRLLHERLGRGLASSLSAYLRAYVAVNLGSMEQVSYSEFIQARHQALRRFGHAGDRSIADFPDSGNAVGRRE